MRQEVDELMKGKRITKDKLMKAAKLSRGTIQFYLQCKLLSPTKGANNYNYFTPDDLLDLQAILIHRSMGCSIKEIKALNNCNKAQSIELFRDKIDAINRQLNELKEKQKILEQWLSVVQYGDKMEKLKVFEEDPGYIMMVEQNIDNNNYIRDLVNYKVPLVSFKSLKKEISTPLTIGVFTKSNIYDTRVVWEKNPDSVFFACVFDLCAPDSEIKKVRKMPTNNELEEKIVEELNELEYDPINLFYTPVFIYHENNNLLAVTKLYIECIQKAKT